MKKIRLNSYISYSGIASRRNADKLIKSGLIKVNNKIITDYGIKVTYNDKIKFKEKYIYPEKKIYIVLNKPKGLISTTKDEKNRKTIINLIPKYLVKKRIYPIGRLDRNTTGIILISNDGHLCKKLIHPKYNIKKIYHVILNKNLSFFKLKKIQNGIFLSEGKVIIDHIDYLNYKKKNEIILTLHIGWNRIIKRIFNKINYQVIKLNRISFGGITNINMKIGEWRFLKKQEINFLQKNLNNES